MKLITFNYSDTGINIYSVRDNLIKGSFFNEKPCVGTIIKHYSTYYKVVRIISNIDAKVSRNCLKNPEKALFELEIVMATTEEIKEVTK